MKAITIRFPDGLDTYIAQQAEANNRSQQQEIVARLEASRKDAITLGWVKLARWGEVDDHDEDGNIAVTCPECGQDMDRSNCYVALLNNGQHYGPVCSACATSE